MTILDQLRGKIVVSCQAYENEALFGSETMAKMALAAKDGGAAAIRANNPDDVAAIKRATGLPVIGIWKRSYEDSEVYITPTLADALTIRKAGADIVALDATQRLRPNRETMEEIVRSLKEDKDILLMADVSTFEEGVYAESIGFDMVSTTLAGYTSYSLQSEEPDYELLEKLVNRLSVPVISEGRIHKPAQVARCLQIGAHFAVIGTAITRPQVLTRQFVESAEGLQVTNRD